MSDDPKTPRTDAEDSAEPTTRERVARHLRKILATSAIAGVGFNAAAGCEDVVVCDPLPPPADGEAGGDNKQPPGGDAFVGDPEPPPGDDATDGDTGGGEPEEGDEPVVCDPLPPPSDGEFGDGDL